MKLWTRWTLRRWLAVCLIASGVILLIIFIPVEFWSIVLGILLVVTGICCL